MGRVVNPLLARSQLEGGIIQGIGHTLSEDRLIDPGTGLTLNPTLDAYQLLTQAGGLYVGNMVDTTYSLVAKCPKRYLRR